MLQHTFPNSLHSILSHLACLTHLHPILLQTVQFSALNLKLFGLRWPFIMAGFLCGSAGKESACNAGDLGKISGLGISPKEGKGYPLQCSGLENSMDRTVHGISESDTTERLSLSLYYGQAASKASKGTLFVYFGCSESSLPHEGFSSSSKRTLLPCGKWDLSSLIKGQTCVPCIWRWILHY